MRSCGFVLPRFLDAGTAAALFVAASCTGSIDQRNQGGDDTPSDDDGAGSGGSGVAGKGGSGGAGGGPIIPGTGGMTGPINPAACGYAPARLWKLTPQQYARTIERAVPGVAVPLSDLTKTTVSVGLFSNDARSIDVSEPQVEALLANATELAKQVSEKPDRVAPCLATRPATASCLRQTLGGFGQRMFRRPLRTTEIDAYIAFHDKEAAAHGADVGLRQLFRAMFMSPNFLYRTELGEDAAVAGKPTKLTSYERASAISYFLTDGPPDDALMEAAAKNQLETPADMEKQARRLLETPDGQEGLVGFFSEQLRVSDVRIATKSATLSAWTPALAEGLAEETRRFVAHEIWEGSGKLSGLFTSATSFVNEPVAKLYGVAGVTGSSFREVTLPAPRRGVLGQASLLAVQAQGDDTSIVKRGRFVRERLLCEAIPAAPPELANVAIPPRPDGIHTQRERIVQHSADPTCSNCHKYMDPIGYGMESFDTIGRFRDKDVTGKPVDASGSVVIDGQPERAFAGFTELGQVLSELPQVQQCATRQLFTYAEGREPDERDACVLQSLGDGFAKTGGDLRELAVKLVASDPFSTRIK